MKEITRKIYFSSLSLRERQSLKDRINVSNKDKINDKELLKRWQYVVGQTSKRYFEARLNWDEIEKKDLPKLLNEISSFNFRNFEFPLWLRYLNKFLSKDFEKTDILNFQELLENNEDQIPFLHLIIPYARFFSGFINNTDKVLSKEAQHDLTKNLVYELSNLTSQSFLEDMRNTEPSYEEYVKKITNDNYRKFFTKYSSLTKLIFIRGIFWVKNTNAFLNDLVRNRDKICKKLNCEELVIKQVGRSISETHNCGKSVYILTTDYDEKFVYKQRDITNDKGFYSFLEEFEGNLPFNYYIPWFIKVDQKAGFMEYIESSSCSNMQKAGKFYQRIGSLLCIYYLFGSTDLHSENLISKTDHPVFIDLETLFRPIFKLNQEHLNKLNEYIDKKFGGSVSATSIMFNIFNHR